MQATHMKDLTIWRWLNSVDQGKDLSVIISNNLKEADANIMLG